MKLAELCWNLPILEASKAPSGDGSRAAIEHAIAGMPDGLSRPLRQLLQSRTTDFAAIPFLVAVRVNGTSLHDARVVAEARMPSTPASQATT